MMDFWKNWLPAFKIFFPYYKWVCDNSDVLNIVII